MPKSQSDIGLIGLAVMGQNLALNIADHGFQISVYNRTTEKTDKFVAENPNTPGGVVGTKTLEEFVQSLAKPRKMIILVQAGKATDAVIDGLVPLLETGRHRDRRRQCALDRHDPPRKGAGAKRACASSAAACPAARKARASARPSCPAASSRPGWN